MAHAGFPNGFGIIALSMLIEELFHMGAQLIFLDTNLNNARAQHVYEELGFKKLQFIMTHGEISYVSCSYPLIRS